MHTLNDAQLKLYMKVDLQSSYKPLVECAQHQVRKRVSLIQLGELVKITVKLWR